MGVAVCESSACSGRLAAEAQVEPLSWWVAVLCFAMFALAFYGHFAYRRYGRLSRSWLRYNYFNENVPGMIRYAPLNMLPISSVFALWGLIAVVSHLPENDVTYWISAVLVVLSAVAAIIAITRHLAGYSDKKKPQWLIDEERRRGIRGE
ncbi:hypothetical protein [Actinomadura geliboluensis]